MIDKLGAAYPVCTLRRIGGKIISILIIVFRPISVSRVIVSIAIIIFFYRGGMLPAPRARNPRAVPLPKKNYIFLLEDLHWFVPPALPLHRLFLPSSLTSSQLYQLFYFIRRNIKFHAPIRSYTKKTSQVNLAVITVL